MATKPNQQQAPKAAELPTATYTVVSPLQHDQVDYPVGSTVELTEAQAKPLLGHTVKAPEAPQQPEAPAE